MEYSPQFQQFLQSFNHSVLGRKKQSTEEMRAAFYKAIACAATDKDILRAVHIAPTQEESDAVALKILDIKQKHPHRVSPEVEASAWRLTPFGAVSFQELSKEAQAIIREQIHPHPGRESTY